eukprot:3078845-Rhodomonas_salina.1
MKAESQRRRKLELSRGRRKELEGDSASCLCAPGPARKVRSRVNQYMSNPDLFECQDQDCPVSLSLSRGVSGGPGEKKRVTSAEPA